MQVNPSRVVALSYSLKSAESLDKPGTGRPAAGDDNQAVRQILEILDFPLTLPRFVFSIRSDFLRIVFLMVARHFFDARYPGRRRRGDATGRRSVTFRPMI